MEWKFGVQMCVFLLAPFIRPQEKGLDVALFPVVNSFGVCRRLMALISFSKNCHKMYSVSVMYLRIPTCLPGSHNQLSSDYCMFTIYKTSILEIVHFDFVCTLAQ